MKIQRGHFIKFPKGFKVDVQDRKKSFTMEPSGLHISYNTHYAWIHYAGEQAGDSYTELIVPSDTKFLREMARELNKFAKRLEEERE